MRLLSADRKLVGLDKKSRLLVEDAQTGRETNRERYGRRGRGGISGRNLHLEHREHRYLVSHRIITLEGVLVRGNGGPGMAGCPVGRGGG